MVTNYVESPPNELTGPMVVASVCAMLGNKYPASHIKEVISTYHRMCREELLRGNAIRIHKVGVLGTRKRKGHKMMCIHTHKVIQAKPTLGLFFKATDNFKVVLNSKPIE